MKDKDIEKIKIIRDRTGSDLESCKKALLYSDYDIDKACILLREIAIGSITFYDIELKKNIKTLKKNLELI